MKYESYIKLEISNGILKEMRMGLKFGLERKNDIKKTYKRKICNVFELPAFSEIVLRYFPD